MSVSYEALCPFPALPPPLPPILQGNCLVNFLFQGNFILEIKTERFFHMADFYFVSLFISLFITALLKLPLLFLNPARDLPINRKNKIIKYKQKNNKRQFQF